jgi:hypothetical protein
MIVRGVVSADIAITSLSVGVVDAAAEAAVVRRRIVTALATAPATASRASSAVTERMVRTGSTAALVLVVPQGRRGRRARKATRVGRASLVRMENVARRVGRVLKA